MIMVEYSLIFELHDGEAQAFQLCFPGFCAFHFVRAQSAAEFILACHPKDSLWVIALALKHQVIFGRLPVTVFVQKINAPQTVAFRDRLAY